MRYHVIKSKIDKAMMSCTTKGQFKIAAKWSKALVARFLSNEDNTLLIWYIDHWDTSKPMPPCPPPNRSIRPIGGWPRE